MGEEIKPAYYAVIPANVRYDKELKPNAKLLFGEITALCNDRGYCWAGNEYFANLYGVGLKTVSAWISELVTRGYLDRKIIFKSGTKEVDVRILRLPVNIPYPSPENSGYPPIKKGIPSPEKNGEGVEDEKPNTENDTNEIPLPRKKRIPPPKKREENITYEYIHEVFNNREDLKKYLNYIPLVEKWLRYKKEEKKQSYKTEESLSSWIKKLIKFSGGDLKIAEDIIETSMANLWEGIYAPDNKKSKPVTLNFTPNQNSSAQTKYGGF